MTLLWLAGAGGSCGSRRTSADGPGFFQISFPFRFQALPRVWRCHALTGILTDHARNTLLFDPFLSAQVAQPQSPPDPQQAPPSRLADESAWRKWLDEDVVYIITDTERNASNALLRTDEEREVFVEEQFWLRCDPTSSIPSANEY